MSGNTQWETYYRMRMNYELKNHLYKICDISDYFERMEALFQLIGEEEWIMIFGKEDIPK